MRLDRVCLYALLTFAALSASVSQAQDSPLSPTFLLFKYQHPVGEETDKCEHSATSVRCTAHFELKFTGESVPLDAEIETDAAFNPKSYVVKGRNSTRSDLNLTVKMTGKQAEIVEDGKSQTVNLNASQHVFTLVQNAPLLIQELLLSYWKKQGRPQRIKLLPAGEVRIKLRGTDQVQNELLSRYTVHGVTWG